tara:strand:- start:21246 stop:22865 length:1620 start_codon:yes stop_codon:yes gene_type:complete
MNKNVFYISDFFLMHIVGGGELNDEELIKMLDEDGHDIIKCQSHLVNLELLQENKDSFFIISNFCNLKRECKQWLQENARYIIYEHDHKYVDTRNPASFKNFKVPKKHIRNHSFYKNAIKVLTQSSFHAGIVKDNLDIDNVVNLSGNLWSMETLSLINALTVNKKKNICSVMKSNIIHKNTYGASQYCQKNNIEYEMIQSENYNDFLKKLSKNNKLVFIPRTPETLSRLVVEARMLGINVITNSLVGASHEPWFSLKGPALIDYMINKRKEIFDTVIKLIEAKKEKQKKKISIVTTYYEGEKFLRGFLENITEQTIFDQCELIIIDSNSPGREQEIVKEFTEKNDNIRYYRIDEKLPPTPCFNMALQKVNTEYVTFGFIDDRKSKDCIENLYNELQSSKVDLVYGDVAQTINENETFDEAKNKKVLFDHSTYEFSKQNMVKCLPGPMPLWKMQIHDECGFFDEEDCNFADDWDMWLRAVDSGFEFKKLNKIVGLYLTGGRSQKENNIEQLKEESRIFYKYKHLFGNNFKVYDPYFRQFT